MINFLIRATIAVFALSLTSVSFAAQRQFTIDEIKAKLDKTVESQEVRELEAKYSDTTPTLEELEEGLKDRSPAVRTYFLVNAVDQKNMDPKLLIPLLADPAVEVRIVAPYYFQIRILHPKNDGMKTAEMIYALKAQYLAEDQLVLKDFLRDRILDINQDFIEKSAVATQLSSDNFRLLFTAADWCGWCKVLRDKLKAEGNPKSIPVKVGVDKYIQLPYTFIDVDRDIKTTEKYHLNKKAVPRLYLMQHDREVYSTYFRESEYNTKGVQRLMARASLSEKTKSQAKLDFEAFENDLRSRPASDSRVILIGTGANRDENPFFVSQTLEFVRRAIQKSFAIADDRIVTLFGGGKNPNQPDIREMISFLPHYIKAPLVKADSSFTPETLQATFNTDRGLGVKKTLLVFSGHGSEDGLDYWNGEDKFTPEDLSKIIKEQDNSVIVSGNCYGGQFAQSSQCGFFAARPDTVASGCWERKEDKIRDYSSTFFQAFKKENKHIANVAKDGSLSFSEAHWFAVTNGAETDTPYTSIDAMVDNYFDKNPSQIPQSLSIDDARNLKTFGTLQEGRAFDILARDVEPHTLITTREHKVGVTISIDRQHYFGSIVESPFTSDTTYRVSLNDADSEKVKAYAIADLLKKRGEVINKDAPARVFLVRMIPDGTSKEFISSSTETKNALSVQFKGEEAITIWISQEAEVETLFSVGNKPILVELIRRLQFEKVMKEQKSETSETVKFKSLSQCENQKITDFLN